MTVKELIEKLKKYDGDELVIVGDPGSLSVRNHMKPGDAYPIWDNLLNWGDEENNNKKNNNNNN